MSATAVLRGVILALANVVSRATPRTRMFAVRRRLFAIGGVHLERGAKLCGGVTFDNPYATIGADTWVGGGTRIVGSPRAVVEVGANCDIGPDVLLVVGTHELAAQSRRAGRGTAEAITVGAGTWIGARAVVLSGVTIGAGCVVAAGAVVASEVPSNTLVAGVPAKVVRHLEEDPTRRARDLGHA